MLRPIEAWSSELIQNPKINSLNVFEELKGMTFIKTNKLFINKDTSD
jgi:hypothetical protein